MKKFKFEFSTDLNLFNEESENFKNYNNQTNEDSQNKRKTLK